MLQLLKEAATARGVKIRVLVPMDKKIKNEMANQLQDLGINIRYNKKPSQTKITTLVVDNAVSLTVELKDDSKEASEEEEAIGLATYSNSESTVLAYVSIFENMWIQSELQYHGNNRKEHRQEHQEQKHPTMYNTTSSKGTVSKQPKLFY